jgi:serine/threonine-protein kinase
MRAEMTDDLTGRLLGGRYRLDRLLAGGGMSRVWAGTDLILNRPVAVKILHTHLAVDDQFVERFRREAVAVARLNHPSIVAIYDTCSDGGCEAIVMELVPGVTLRQYLDEHGALPVRIALTIGAQVAAALGEAHQAGIIHRDIKPANILLSTRGNEDAGRNVADTDSVRGDIQRVLVTDFGIAKAIDAARAETADLTRTGSVLGTAKYVAPEQLEGQPVDARTDVYALGLVLYEILCGRPPWSTDSSMSTALARLHSDPLRPRQVRPDIPREVERIVLRAMARRPGDRYASAADLRAALLAAERAAGADETAVAAIPTVLDRDVSFVRSERSWLVPTAAVVVVAVALAVAGILFGRTDAGHGLVDRVASAFGASSQKATTTTTTAGPAQPVAIDKVTDVDPDGDRAEHPELVGNVVDGDPATTWSTQRYNQNFPALEPGVGLSFALHQAATLRAVKITTPTTGWQASLYVADRATTAGPSSWGQPVATFTADSATTTVDLPPNTKGQAVLLWITSLGPARSDGRFAVEVGGVELSG